METRTAFSIVFTLTVLSFLFGVWTSEITIASKFINSGFILAIISACLWLKDKEDGE